MDNVIIVGGGVAGLRAAIEVQRAGCRATVITKSHPLRSFSISLQDGMNAAMGRQDSWQSHAQDTLSHGAYLSDQDVVEIVCQGAPQVIEELDSMGMPFHRETSTGFALSSLRGSSIPRTATVHDITGHALMQVLYEQALKANTLFLEEWYAVSLIVEEGRCCGVLAVDLATGKIEEFYAKSVILATGGSRRLYEPSTGSLLCTGDGVALAYRAGAALMDMEMVQYHPCVIKNGRMALSELLLARNVEIVNGNGEVVTPSLGQDGSWGMGMVRSIFREISEGRSTDGFVFLKTVVEPGATESTFEMTNIRLGMFLKTQIGKDLIPVTPAMHRSLGGIATDVNGATTIPGLFAAGQCAGVGIHGANALDGNGLISSVMFGSRAGEAASQVAGAPSLSGSSGTILQNQIQSRKELENRSGTGSAASIRGELAKTMQRYVGLSRTSSGLNQAAQHVQELKQQYASLGLKNTAMDFNFELLHLNEVSCLLDVAEAIIASAHAREESRGVHVREDYPNTNDDVWVKHVMVQSGDSGPEVSDRPVTVTQWPINGQS